MNGKFDSSIPDDEAKKKIKKHGMEKDAFKQHKKGSKKTIEDSKKGMEIQKEMEEYEKKKKGNK